MSADRRAELDKAIRDLEARLARTKNKREWRRLLMEIYRLRKERRRLK